MALFADKSLSEDEMNLKKEKINEQYATLEQVQHQPILVNQLIINGAKRTDHSLIYFWFGSVFNASNLAGLTIASHHSLEAMNQSGCFRRSGIELKPTEIQPITSTGEILTDVILNVEERNLTASAQANLTGDDVETTGKINLLNVTGQCDKIYFDTSVYNTSENRSLTLGYSNPLLRRPGQFFDLRLSRSYNDYTKESAYTSLAHSFAFLYNFGRHELLYSWSWRELQLMNNPTATLFPFAGHSVKSSVRHTYTFDTRDSAQMPTAGYAFKLINELAGIGGDVRFSKHEMAFQHNIPLIRFQTLPPVTFGSLFRAGTLLHDKSSKLSPCDRFHLGGATSFAGFARRGAAGQSSRRAALGGHAFWSASGSLTWPWPWASSFGSDVRAHAFGQVGNVVGGVGDDMHQVDWFADYRASVGCGIVCGFAGSRIEFNYSVPVKSTLYDRQQSWQLGVSFSLI